MKNKSFSESEQDFIQYILPKEFESQKEKEDFWLKFEKNIQFCLSQPTVGLSDDNKTSE